MKKINKCLTGFKQGFLCLNPIKHFFICPILSTKRLLNQAPSCDVHVTLPSSCRRRAGLPVSTLVSPHPDGGCERSQSGVLMWCPWNQMIPTPAKSQKAGGEESWARYTVYPHICVTQASLSLSALRLPRCLLLKSVSMLKLHTCLSHSLSVCLPAVLLEWLLCPQKQVCIPACVGNLVNKGMSLCPAASFSGGFTHPYLWLLSLQLTRPSDPVKTFCPQAGGGGLCPPCWFELCPHLRLMNPSGLQTLNTGGILHNIAAIEIETLGLQKWTQIQKGGSRWMEESMEEYLCVCVWLCLFMRLSSQISEKSVTRE